MAWLSHSRQQSVNEYVFAGAELLDFHDGSSKGVHLKRLIIDAFRIYLIANIRLIGQGTDWE